jgi:heme exporter protein C
MIQLLANPQKFMAFSKWAAPILGVLAVVGLGIGLNLAFSVPDDYQQKQTVRLLFIHPQLAIVSEAIYFSMALAAFFGFVFRHALADAAARAAAPIGVAFTFLMLLTGSLWGRPMWGTYWQWSDPRLDSALVLLLLFLGYMALNAAIDDEQKASRASNILAMVGVINLPIIKFSVLWWNSLHQGASFSLATLVAAVFGRDDGPGLARPYVAPFLLDTLGLMALFGALWLVRTRAEVWRRRAGALAVQAAQAA